jgi:4-amino-4-deoxy-L-arabinose transferase-like glycosyltransferase
MPSVRPPRRPSSRAGSAVSLGWLAMFGVALGLRVVWAWVAVGPGGSPGTDSAAYDQVALNLSNGLGVSLDSPSASRATAIVPPIVPWLASLFYRAAGHHYFEAVLLQCLVASLVPLLVAALGRSLFGDPMGRWAGWLAAVHPLLIGHSAELRAETVFCAALLLALGLSADWVRSPRGGRALGVGLAWGVAILTLPTAIPLPVIVAAWAWRPVGLTVGGTARGRQLVLVLLGLALVVGPWTLRNAIALRAFVPVTTSGGPALMIGNNPAAWDDPAARGRPRVAAYEAALASDFRGLGEAEVDVRARARTWAFVRSRPGDWPTIAMAKLVRFWWPNGDDERSGFRSAARLPLDPTHVWWVVTLPFALWGIARTLRGGRRWFQLLPLLVVVHFMMVAVVFFGTPRMRLPAEPMVTLLAALGLEDAWRRRRVRRGGLVLVPKSP